MYGWCTVCVKWPVRTFRLTGQNAVYLFGCYAEGLMCVWYVAMMLLFFTVCWFIKFSSWHFIGHLSTLVSNFLPSLFIITLYFIVIQIWGSVILSGNILWVCHYISCKFVQLVRWRKVSGKSYRACCLLEKVLCSMWKSILFPQVYVYYVFVMSFQ
jgi:hypothetical protein